VVNSHGQIIFYSNPRQSLYRNIDEIEVILGLKQQTENGENIQKLMSNYTSPHDCDKNAWI